MSYLNELNMELIEASTELQIKKQALEEEIESIHLDIKRATATKEKAEAAASSYLKNYQEQENKLNELKQSVMKYENAMNVLNMADTYNEDYAKKKKDIDSLNKEISKYNEQYKKVKEEYTKYETLCINTKDSYNALLDSIKTITKTVKDEEEKVVVLREEYTKLTEKLKNIKEEYANIDQSLSGYKIDKDQLSFECTNLVKINKKLTKEIKERQASINTEVATLKAKASAEIETYKDNAKKELDAKKSKLLEDMRNSIETRKAQAELKRDEIINNANIEREKILTQALNEKQLTIKEATAEVEFINKQQEGVLEELNTTIEKNKGFLMGLDERIESSKEQYQNLNKEIGQLTSSRTSLTGQVVKLKEDIEKLKAVIVENDSILQIESLKVEIEDLNNIIEELNEKNEELSNTILTKNTEIQTLKKDRLEYSDAALLESNDKKDYIIEQLQTNLKESNTIIATMKEDLKSGTDTDLKKEIIRLKKEHKKALLSTNKVVHEKPSNAPVAIAALVMTIAFTLNARILGFNIIDKVLIATSSLLLVWAGIRNIASSLRNKKELLTKNIMEESSVETEEEAKKQVLKQRMRNMVGTNEDHLIEVVKYEEDDALATEEYRLVIEDTLDIETTLNNSNDTNTQEESLDKQVESEIAITEDNTSKEGELDIASIESGELNESRGE